MTEVSKLNRFLASLIDCVVAFGPGIFIGFLGLGLIDTILSLLGLGYFLLKDALFEGQSIGQQFFLISNRLVDIRVHLEVPSLVLQSEYKDSCT